MTLHKNFYNQHKKINENNVFFMSKGRIYLVLYYGGLFKFKKKLYTNVYANASKDFQNII